MSILGNLIKEQMERSVKLRGQYPPATLVTPLEMLCLRQELGMKPDQAPYPFERINPHYYRV